MAERHAMRQRQREQRKASGGRRQAAGGRIVGSSGGSSSRSGSAGGSIGASLAGNGGSGERLSNGWGSCARLVEAGGVLRLSSCGSRFPLTAAATATQNRYDLSWRLCPLLSSCLDCQCPFLGRCRFRLESFFLRGAVANLLNMLSMFWHIQRVLSSGAL